MEGKYGGKQYEDDSGKMKVVASGEAYGETRLKE